MDSDVCNICLEECVTPFQPLNRIESCLCAYTVHHECYNSWINSSDMAYNCIICHKTLSYNELQEILDSKEEQELARAFGIIQANAIKREKNNARANYIITGMMIASIFTLFGGPINAFKIGWILVFVIVLEERRESIGSVHT